jgi:predicted AlkP superfamily pyrophosphatase or phosphodiesterase
LTGTGLPFKGVGRQTAFNSSVKDGMRPLIVLNVVGLARRFVGDATPNIMRLAARGGLRGLDTVTPAVTCSVQSTLLTGLPPDGHGIVGNGWYFRDLGEVFLWRQSNRLVAGEKVWDAARRRNESFTCANLFWWYAMHAGTDIAVTPRPMYLADGRKIPDFWSSPADLRDELTRMLGPFPLFHFWGPAADIRSSRWIADAALHVLRTRAPTLTLIYLPHLDYVLQRHGPAHKSVQGDLAAIDAVCGDILAEADRSGAAVMLLSEYGITDVSRPVHINRALREAGWLQVRDELGHDQFDPANSDAFAVADHQIAHVYVRRPELLADVAACLAALPGVDRVLDADGKRSFGLDHPRSGELVALAETDSWFSWYHWLDDAKAPDFARTVEIHRKHGYDPVELFLDPALRFPRVSVAWRLAKRRLGFRSLMDVVPLDATLVRGSHGRVTADTMDGPVLISSDPALLPAGAVSAASVKALMLRHMFPATESE